MIMKKTSSDRLRVVVTFWFPFLVWALLIFAFSSRTTGIVTEIHWQDFVFKKTIHVIEYFVFCLLLFRALKASGVKELKNALFISFYSALVYGITDEIHQSFIPGRTANVRDIVIDGTGAMFSVYFVSKLKFKFPKRIQKFFKQLEI